LIRTAELINLVTTLNVRNMKIISREDTKQIDLTEKPMIKSLISKILNDTRQLNHFYTSLNFEVKTGLADFNIHTNI